MLWTTTFRVLAIAGTALALQRRQKDQSIANENATISIPNRYIIEVASPSEARKLADQLNAKARAKVLKVFDSALFSGVSVEAPGENLDTLQALQPSANVWRSQRIALSQLIEGKSFSNDAESPSYSLHGMTGVDKLHKAGILGKGAVVAVIDSGIDYYHHALGGGFGPGNKVAGGYDLVGDGWWPDEGPREPDDDPYPISSHGTHVAGIIAGKSDQYIGVAPEATLLSYKVFSRSRYTDDTVLMEAFIMAFEAGADIITASIGGAGGFSSNAWAVLASRMVDQGAVVTIAAGNNGELGPFFGSNGASGQNVLAVASLEANKRPVAPIAANFTENGVTNATKIGYLPGIWYWDPTLTNLSVFAATTDPEDRMAGCTELPSSHRNFTENEVILVGKGGCEFENKQDNYAKFGAKYVLFYNDDEEMSKPVSWNWDIEYGLITKESGTAMIKALAAGVTISLDFSLDPNTNFVGIPYIRGGLPSYFSSLGGTYDLQIKPDIAAPGGNVFSTWPGDTYMVNSGTSMACPYVAGVAALWIGKNGGRKVHGAGVGKALTARILASGDAVPWWDGREWTDPPNSVGFFAPVSQVGSGIINAVKVLEYKTSLSYAKFALNDTHHFSRYHKVDVTNSGPVPVTYKFSVEEWGGFEALYPYDKDSNPQSGVINGHPWADEYDGMFSPVKMSPKVSLPGGTFTVQPGQTKTAQFNFEAPLGLNANNLPVYSGKILITGSNGEVLGVPYFGVATDLKNTFRNMFYTGWPQGGSTINNVPFDVKPTLTFDLSPAAQDFAKVAFRIRWGGHQVRWDIFESGWKEREWKYPPVVGQNKYVGSATFWNFPGNAPRYFNPEVHNATDVDNFPMTEVYRTLQDEGYRQLWWLGTLGNGSTILPGNYTMRFASLAPFGNPVNSDTWSTFIANIQVLPRST